jgi:hypothetical protein
VKEATMDTPDEKHVHAVAVYRWRFEIEGSSVGRWWYEITVEGARGGRYEVSVMHPDGQNPVPFKVTRAGRSTRKMGRSQWDLRLAVERAALAAVEVTR